MLFYFNLIKNDIPDERFSTKFCSIIFSVYSKDLKALDWSSLKKKRIVLQGVHSILMYACGHNRKVFDEYRITRLMHYSHNERCQICFMFVTESSCIFKASEEIRNSNGLDKHLIWLDCDNDLLGS